ncbi:phosphoserine phosphatase SerB [Candidatus Pantoea carbekii]|uniref:Phosphoserine phosphatase n=1 Tax=Candidatus Pantoea carbekii TaxID=1235990 RepID=U3U7S9_9GAMM|nr:phosphoserine phosphatase SerB [Candidatus Pantoea carbekii]BAO00487.1 SerB protein [Candidatus Pantoea carbekii]
MPLCYQNQQNHWLLYGRRLSKQKVAEYFYQLKDAYTIINDWNIDDYQVIHISGSLTTFAIQLAYNKGFDVVQLSQIPYLNIPGLLLMDMDSTAIQIECIDEIAKLAGYGIQVTEITERAMCGEMDFETSLRKRVSILKGTDASILKKVLDELPLTPGLTRLVEKLKNFNWKIAIASGGFTFYTNYLYHKLHLNAAFANKLEICNGKVTGKILGQIVNAQYKAQILNTLAKSFNISSTQTVAIGDGVNDLAMIKNAALGIAYHAKPKVNKHTKVMIRHADLMGVFCILSSSLIDY